VLPRQCEEEPVKVVNEGVVGRGKWLSFSAQKQLYLKKGSKKEKTDKHDICCSANVGFLVCQKTAGFCSMKLFLSQVVLS